MRRAVQPRAATTSTRARQSPNLRTHHLRLATKTYRFDVSCILSAAGPFAREWTGQSARKTPRSKRTAPVSA